jgi:signal transduction histidine kinase
METFLGVPITRDGRPIGDLYMTDKRGGQPFAPEDQRLVELFARHAAIAMDNARLHDRIAALAIVEERERIGRDLHDGIIQRLYAVSLSLEDVGELATEDPSQVEARVDRAIASLQTTIGDIRHFILGLRPGLMTASDLVGGLDRLAEEVRFGTVIAVETDIDPEAAAALDDEAATQLLGLAREALSNASRHSNASTITVRLARDDAGVCLAVEDDGVGFDPMRTFGPDHQGLTNMRERAELLGGTLLIERQPGGGTRVIATIPVAGGHGA